MLPATVPAVGGDARRSHDADRVDVRPAGRVVLRLLRGRVLERTREALELAVDDAPAAAFAEPPLRADDAGGLAPPALEVFVGRLLSSQNLLAGARRGRWAEARIDAALQHGMTAGLAETFDILTEVGEVDARTAAALHAVLDELHRKVRDGLAQPPLPASSGSSNSGSAQSRSSR